MQTQPVAPEYVLGRSETESQRLIKQAGFLRPSTERVLGKAGITTGMRVLDLGCGVGDVSFLVAELVGPTGSVTGIDQNPGVLAVAHRRAQEREFTQVTFVESSINSFRTTEPFDAVVGRFVLMYQADPIVTLTHAFSLLSTGGLLVLQEPDFGVGIITCPPVPLWQQVTGWLREGFHKGGVHHDIGGRLYHVFRRAGLPGPAMLHHVSVGGAAAMRPYCENCTELIRSLLPKIEQFGIATADLVQVDTLADRLERDTSAVECQISSVPIVAAWTVKS